MTKLSKKIIIIKFVTKGVKNVFEMVNKKISEINRYSFVRTVSTGLLIVIFLTSIIVPQAVNTKTGQVLIGLTRMENMTNIVEKRDKFPIANVRESRYAMTVIATSYSSDPRQTDDTPCLPAMNYDLCSAAEMGVVNTIASNFLRLGTQVRFPDLYGDKIFVVRDRMNARYNGTNRIDFYSAELDENGNIDISASTLVARQFGVKKLTMEVM